VRVCSEILLLSRNNWLEKRIGLPWLLFMYDGQSVTWFVWRWFCVRCGRWWHKFFFWVQADICLIKN
jgi:hypothetical protein